MSKPYMKVSSDFTKSFNQAMSKFRNESVLIGIPEERGPRDDTGISNAALLAINNYGSPAQNIPAFPVMSIGIRNAQPQIAEQFKKAAQNALSKGLSAIDQYYERIGIIGSNSIKAAINDQEGAPALAESTLKARKTAGFSGTKRMIVTAQVRNAITYVRRGA